MEHVFKKKRKKIHTKYFFYYYRKIRVNQIGVSHLSYFYVFNIIKTQNTFCVFLYLKEIYISFFRYNGKYNLLIQ